MAIPDFRQDGYLPIGLHPSTEAEALFRFGSATRRRRQLALRVAEWLKLCRASGCERFLLDGSFVTDKPNPGDVDAVVLLASDFSDRLARSEAAPIRLESMLMHRQPEEIFAAEDERDWQDWVEFFSRTRELDRRRKGLVEVEL